MSRRRRAARHAGRQSQPNQQRPAGATPSQPALRTAGPATPATAVNRTAMLERSLQRQQSAAVPTTAMVQQPQQHASVSPEHDLVRARTLRKDQERALRAYAWAKDAHNIKEYETAVQNFAAALLRSGFAVAVSLLEQNKKRTEFERLLRQLASRDLPGLPASDMAEWPARVRGLSEITLYMQATRELVALLGWLRRACRAVQAE